MLLNKFKKMFVVSTILSFIAIVLIVIRLGRRRCCESKENSDKTTDENGYLADTEETHADNVLEEERKDDPKKKNHNKLLHLIAEMGYKHEQVDHLLKVIRGNYFTDKMCVERVFALKDVLSDYLNNLDIPEDGEASLLRKVITDKEKLKKQLELLKELENLQRLQLSCGGGGGVAV